MHPDRFTSSVEILEPRITPAGNVTAEVVGTHLIVTGDADDNAVELIDLPDGSWGLRPADSSTTINGSAEPQSLARVINFVSFSMKGGDDLVRLPDEGLPFPNDSMRIPVDLTIDGGDGDDTVELLTPITVGGNFTINGGDGDNTVELLAPVTVHGNLIITNGNGNDRTEIHELSLDESTHQKVKVLNGDGNSITRIDGGRSDDSLVLGNVLISNGIGAEVTVAISNVGLFKKLRILVPNAGSARVSIGDPQGEPWETSLVDGQIVTGAGRDEIEFVNTELYGTWSLTTGEGDDYVRMDNVSHFKRRLSISTGGGADVVNIEGGEGSAHPSTFNRPVDVRLGTGDDLLRLGTAANFSTSVQLYAATFWNGGRGRDRIDFSNVVAYGATPDYKGFETFGARALFEAPVRYDLLGNNTDAIDLASADVNGDGNLDLIVLAPPLESQPYSPPSYAVHVLLGNGDGTFTHAGEYDAGEFEDDATPNGLSVGDFDGTNGPDLVIANANDDVVSVFLNNGDGSFSPRTTFNAGVYSPVQTQVGDYNGDTKLDLAVLGRGAVVSILLGSGDGTLSFSEVVDANVSSPSIGVSDDIVAGDVDGDGKLDLVAATGYGMALLLGNGDGTFRVTADSSLDVGRVHLADMNNDGKLDLLLQGDHLELQLGNGDGTFQQSRVISEEDAGYVHDIFSGYAGIVVSDFNKDGKADVLVQHYGAGTSGDSIYVLLGRGDGTFQPPLDFGRGTEFLWGPMAVGDFDRDGFQDLALTDYRLLVFLNRGNRY